MGRVNLRIQPGAKRTKLVGWFGDLPKLAVAAPPVDGAANEAAVRALADLLGVKPRQVSLVGGATSRTKRFEVDGIATDDLQRRITELTPG